VVVPVKRKPPVVPVVVGRVQVVQQPLLLVRSIRVPVAVEEPIQIIFLAHREVREWLYFATQIIRQ
jgi:hypothetical protein